LEQFFDVDSDGESECASELINCSEIPRSTRVEFCMGIVSPTDEFFFWLMKGLVVVMVVDVVALASIAIYLL
jgi:hypothetical protein